MLRALGFPVPRVPAEGPASAPGGGRPRAALTEHTLRDAHSASAATSFLCVAVLGQVRGGPRRGRGPAETESDLPEATFRPRTCRNDDPAVPAARPVAQRSGNASPSFGLFASSQLIVLPKLDDLFLELKEMQLREKGTDKAQDREGGGQRRCRRTGRCLHPQTNTPSQGEGCSGPLGAGG